jgi:predicted RNA binding protein YcfA (HicA-like mRNA interferase family)
MPPVPLLQPSDVVKAFENRGWQVVRRKGSHIILTKTGNINTLSVPDHPQVARGTLRGLIARTGMTVEDFMKALGE